MTYTVVMSSDNNLHIGSGQFVFHVFSHDVASCMSCTISSEEFQPLLLELIHTSICGLAAILIFKLLHHNSKTIKESNLLPLLNALFLVLRKLYQCHLIYIILYEDQRSNFVTPGERDWE